MAEEGCKTPGQMLFYMNKAAKELYGKEDMKAFIESEKASNKTPEERANSLYAIHIEAEASCEAIATQLKDQIKDSCMNNIIGLSEQDRIDLNNEYDELEREIYQLTCVA